MNVWSTLVALTGFGIEISRGALTLGERFTPWPVSLLPRLARLPLDVAANAVRAVGGTGSPPREPEPTTPRRTERTPTRPTERSTQDRSAPSPDARTATIAGARSDGPDDAPRHDRAFRARQAPLYVRDAGSGPAIVLLHAFPLSSRMWEPQLRSLSSRCRVVAPDLAGFGLSWTSDGSFSLDEQAHAVELTLDDLRVDELVLVGASMGGYVALPLVQRLGARVRGLVLANTRATADDEQTIDERHRLAAEVEADGVDVAADELLPRLLGATSTRDDPALVEHVHALVLENKEAGVVGALRAMAARSDASALLPSIECPVLVIAGDEDTLVSVAEARAMAAQIRDAQLAVLRAGHLPNLEATGEFDRVLGSFARRAHDATPRTARGARRAHG